MGSTSDELRRIADAILIIASSITELRRDIDRLEATVAHHRERVEDLMLDAAKQSPAIAPPPPATVAIVPATSQQSFELTHDGALLRWKALPALWRWSKWALIPAAGAALDRLVVWLQHLR
jgi:hypothetical protein